MSDSKITHKFKINDPVVVVKYFGDPNFSKRFIITKLNDNGTYEMVSAKVDGNGECVLSPENIIVDQVKEKTLLLYVNCYASLSKIEHNLRPRDWKE